MISPVETPMNTLNETQLIINLGQTHLV